MAERKPSRRRSLDERKPVRYAVVGLGHIGEFSRGREPFGGGQEYRGSQEYRGREEYGSGFRGQGLYGGSQGSPTGGRFGQGETGQPDFSGKGPKGWKRSDERIKEAVSEQFARHPDLDPSDVEVTVRESVIILTGTVSDRDAKRLAEDIAERVQGAKDVTNQIRVQSQASGSSGGMSSTGTSATGTSNMEETSRSRSDSRAGTT